MCAECGETERHTQFDTLRNFKATHDLSQMLADIREMWVSEIEFESTQTC